MKNLKKGVESELKYTLAFTIYGIYKKEDFHKIQSFFYS